MNNTIAIVQKNQCCACFSCVNACPMNCITMEKSREGSLYPHINEGKCIKCGKCLSVCPAVNAVETNLPQFVYAAFSKNKDIRRLSTSGGFATLIAYKIIARGGVVYGAAFDEEEVQHIRVASYNDVQKIQGSKYVHSHLNNVYKQIALDMQHNFPIVFVGTPCQIAGLKQYFKTIPDNLILIDILCHGVTSLDCFKNGLQLETDKNASKITFRDNNRYCLRCCDENGKCIFSTPYRASYWYNGFVEGYLFRENCYSCKYAGKERMGDITIGDFWGLKNGYDIENGVNFVAVNTKKGATLWDLVNDDLKYQVRSFEEEITFNHSLSRPADKPKGYNRFKALYKLLGGKSAILLSFPLKTVFIMIRRLIRKHQKVYLLAINIPAIGNKISDYPK